MIAPSSTFSLDRFTKDRGMTETELNILKLYFGIGPAKRQAALSYFLNGPKEEKKPKLAEIHLSAAQEIQIICRSFLLFYRKPRILLIDRNVCIFLSYLPII